MGLLPPPPPFFFPRFVRLQDLIHSCLTLVAQRTDFFAAFLYIPQLCTEVFIVCGGGPCPSGGFRRGS